MEAVVFDMDGVLFDTERISSECWRTVAKRHNIDNIEVAAVGCVGLNGNDTRQFMKEHYGDAFHYDEYMGEISALFKEKLEEELPMKPGVMEILNYLKEKKMKIGLASSSRKESVLHHIKKAAIEDYFEVVIGGDMIEHSKPLPDIYLLACTELGVDPKKAFAIEDSPNGIRSAYAAGMKVIMVPDLIPANAELKKMFCTKQDSLLDVIDWMEKNQLSQ